MHTKPTATLALLLLLTCVPMSVFGQSLVARSAAASQKDEEQAQSRYSQHVIHGTSR